MGTNRKEEIILTTLELAAKKGLSGVSMSMIADKIGIKKPSLYKHFSSKEEIVETMYQFLREQSKKNANIKLVDFSQFFQGKTAYEVLQGVVQGYANMNHQEKLLTFYKVIYSERSIQPMAARIVAEETERMIIATKQLFYAMEVHKLLHFENADMSALSFAMTVHGLLGIVALLSYTAAVVFSPLAYPGYDWMAQAVSDLSASNAPSLRLWNQLSSLYNVCTLVCAMMVCVGIQGKKTRLLRVGIYLFTIVLLSIVSLVLIIIAGAKDKSCRSYGIFAAIALGMMMVGAMGMNIVPKNYFGIVERFSVFAATGYNAVLGIELYRMKF